MPRVRSHVAFLNHMTQFHMRFPTDIQVDCQGLSQDVDKQNRFSAESDKISRVELNVKLLENAGRASSGNRLFSVIFNVLCLSLIHI